MSFLNGESEDLKKVTDDDSNTIQNDCKSESRRVVFANPQEDNVDITEVGGSSNRDTISNGDQNDGQESDANQYYGSSDNQYQNQGQNSDLETVEPGYRQRSSSSGVNDNSFFPRPKTRDTGTQYDLELTQYQQFEGEHRLSSLQSDPNSTNSNDILIFGDRFYEILAIVMAFPTVVTESDTNSNSSTDRSTSSGIRRQFSASDKAILISSASMNFCMIAYAFSFALVDPIAVSNLVKQYAAATNSSDNDTNTAGTVTAAAASELAMINYGKVQSFYSMMQVVSSLYIGTIVDRYDPKLGILGTMVLGSASSHFALYLSKDMYTLYASRIPCVFQATGLVVQAAVVKYQNLYYYQLKKNNSNDNRLSTAPSLGRTFLLYRIGAALGTMVSGHLITNNGNHNVALIAAITAFASACVGYYGATDVQKIKGMIEWEQGQGQGTVMNQNQNVQTDRGQQTQFRQVEPSSSSTQQPQSQSSQTVTTSVANSNSDDYFLQSTIHLLQTNPHLRTIIISTCLLAMTRTLYTTSIPFVAKDLFGMGDNALGYLLGSGVFAGIVASGILIELLTRWFGQNDPESMVVIYSNLVSGGCMLLYGLIPLSMNSMGSGPLYAVTFPMNLAMALSETIYVSLAADSIKKVNKLAQQRNDNDDDSETTNDKKSLSGTGPGKTNTKTNSKSQDSQPKESEEESHDENLSGTAISTLHATFSFVEVVGPSIGSSIYSSLGILSLGSVGSGLSVLSSLTMWYGME